MTINARLEEIAKGNATVRDAIDKAKDKRIEELERQLAEALKLVRSLGGEGPPANAIRALPDEAQTNG